jgi:hypothetical protein
VTPISTTIALTKDADPSTAELDNVVNLWICDDLVNFGECTLNGEGELLVHELLWNAFDPEGVGAFELQVKFDHKIFDINIKDTGVLYSTGRIPAATPGTGGCSMSIISENDIRYGCVSKNPTDGNGNPIVTLGIQGAGPFDLAVLHILPEPDLIFRLHPGQENGIVRVILDENCEAADIFGDPLADANGDPLPGMVTGGLIEDCSDVSVTVRMLEGDLNLDCIVDVMDDQAIAFRYGAFFGSTRYDPWFDMEPALKDFDIDVKDLQKVFGRNGSICSPSGMPEDGTLPPQPPVNGLSNGPL